MNRPRSDFLIDIDSFVLEKPIFCKKAAGEINKESAGSPEPFLAFPQEGKTQTESMGQYNDTRSDHFFTSNRSLPFPVLVSEFSDKSKISEQTKRSEIKAGNCDPNNVKTNRPFNPDRNQARPLSPSIKSIADQTAKAAFIRTLITERLNSCSPLGRNDLFE